MEAAKAAEDNQGPTAAEQARSLLLSGEGEAIKPSDDAVQRQSPPNTNLIQLHNDNFVSANSQNVLLQQLQKLNLTPEQLTQLG